MRSRRECRRLCGGGWGQLFDAQDHAHACTHTKSKKQGTNDVSVNNSINRRTVAFVEQTAHFYATTKGRLREVNMQQFRHAAVCVDSLILSLGACVDLYPHPSELGASPARVPATATPAPAPNKGELRDHRATVPVTLPVAATSASSKSSRR